MTIVKEGIYMIFVIASNNQKKIKELDRIGVPKVIVGKAIYEKRITLDDIRKWSLNE